MDFKFYFKEFLRNLKLSFVDRKYLLLFAFLLFVIPLLLGYFYAESLIFILDPVVKSFGEQVQNGAIGLTTLSIFFNNFKVAIVLFVGGALFGVTAILVLAFNGLFIGYFGTKVPIVSYLAFIIPHGIFEVPGLVLSAFAGFILCSFIIKIIKGLFTKDLKKSDKIKLVFNENLDMLKQSLALLILAIILIFVAAFIEVNLTQYIAVNVFNVSLPNLK